MPYHLFVPSHTTIYSIFTWKQHPTTIIGYTYSNLFPSLMISRGSLIILLLLNDSWIPTLNLSWIHIYVFFSKNSLIMFHSWDLSSIFSFHILSHSYTNHNINPEWTIFPKESSFYTSLTLLCEPSHNTYPMDNLSLYLIKRSFTTHLILNLLNTSSLSSSIVCYVFYTIPKTSTHI